MTWQEHAACAGHPNPTIWFVDGNWKSSPATRVKVSAAIAICQTCPVRARCLQEALHNREEFGIWGGTLPQTRRPDRTTGLTPNQIAERFDLWWKTRNTPKPPKPAAVGPRKNPNQPTYNKTCATCDADFVARRKFARFCSRKCANVDTHARRNQRNAERQKTA